MRTIDEAIDALPKDSPYRDVLAGMWSTDAEKRRTAEQALMKLSRPYYEKIVALPEDVTTTLLRAVLEIPAPPTKSSWGVERVASALLGSIRPSMLGMIRTGYEKANEEVRLALLTNVAAVGTEEGARTFVDIVRTYGWTKSTYQRLFSELSKNLQYANILFPELLTAERARELELGDLLIRALHAKHLDPARMNGTKVATTLGPRLDALIAGPPEPEAMGELAMRLDLAGYLGGANEMVPRIRAALGVGATWPVAFAIVSLLRRGEEVPDAVVRRVASDAATRATLYVLLEGLGATARIPAEFRTRDAFAETDIVEWLSHPGELGEPPKAIERMAVFDARKDGKDIALYVWRFRGHDGKWKAGVSGPYPHDAPEGPLPGASTFSRFDAWEKHTPEEHAAAVLKTLDEWSQAHAER